MAVRSTDYVALNCNIIIQWKEKNMEESCYSLLVKILEFKWTGWKNWKRSLSHQVRRPGVERGTTTVQVETFNSYRESMIRHMMIQLNKFIESGSCRQTGSW